MKTLLEVFYPMKEKATVIFSIRISKTEKEKLQALSDSTGISRNQLIRTAIKKYIK